MENGFDKWNKIKKELSKKELSLNIYPREIWWCYLGINVGVETNGKNKSFKRPVIIMKVYNKDTVLVLPLTSREKKDLFHYKIKTMGVISYVKLTQSRVISNRRLCIKIESLNKETFKDLKKKWIKFIL